MNIFFTSDLHFGHKNIIKYCNRPWSCAEDMDEGIIAYWNSVVAPNDIVYVLGDVVMGNVGVGVRNLGRLNGVKELIAGNHDAKTRKMPSFQKYFCQIVDYLERKLDGQHIVMSHYPMLSWNRSGHGSWMLHGHVHGSFACDGARLRFDVGLDANDWTPVAFEDIPVLFAASQIRARLDETP